MSDEERGDPAQRDPWERYYDPYDDDWYERHCKTGVDQAWRLASARIDAAAPFNRIRGLARRWSLGSARAPQPELERSVLEHIEGIVRGELGDSLTDSDEELAALHELRAGPLAHCHQLAVELALFRPFWLRSPATWTPGRAIGLVDHLFVAYDYPRFLRNAWNKDFDLHWLAWMVVSCQGGSLRRLAELAAASSLAGQWPRVGKKLPGLLPAVPRGYPPSTGYTYAEVHRLGGSELEFRRLEASPALAGTALAPDPADREFWASTVVWLTRHREELDDHACRDLLLWAHHLHTEAQREGRGFRWTGRTAASALRDALEYEAERRRYWRFSPRGRERLVWPKLELEWSVDVGEVRWEVVELASSDALALESARMHHCVHGYAYRCASRTSAIFSVTRAGHPRLTIELSLPSRRVVQVRGPFNRAATREEEQILGRWYESWAVHGEG